LEIELHSAVSHLPEIFSVLVAPVEVFANVLNSHPELQRYKTIFIYGNYSLILCRLDRNTFLCRHCTRTCRRSPARPTGCSASAMGRLKASEGRGEDAGRAENAGGVLMRWPWIIKEL
jgi:hypothetical protein